MNNELFEKLLYEEEGTTLDFKRNQYRFVKASDDEKSELLKDILGFANAWRRSEAYILIGVEDIRGGRGNVVGISSEDHLLDHSLQQFVKSHTNQPVRFHYEAFEFEEKQVGIIRIEEQHRPVYLIHNYGKLTKREVYIRRGSSTDPTQPALPDEIAQMGISTYPTVAELTVEFADPIRSEKLGERISWVAEFCKMPAKETIPDLENKRNFFGFDPTVFRRLTYKHNNNFYRDLADFEFMRRLFKPVRLSISNRGEVLARNVKLEMKTSKGFGIRLLNEYDMPEAPEKCVNIFSSIEKNIPHISSYPGEVCIVENTDEFQIDIECDVIQPGRQIFSGSFLLGKDESGEIILNGMIFADNLPEPKAFRLIVNTSVKKTAMTIDELCSGKIR